MLHLAAKIRGATVRALDGEIGAVEDFYFEEAQWAVRYLLVDTGRWLSGRRVLLSPMSVGKEWTRAEVPVALMKDQVWHSPEVDLERPPSRDAESRLLGHYGYPFYWDASGIWGAFGYPAALTTAAAPASPASAEDRTRIDLESQHLRSTREIAGYHLHATDGEIGHVDDFLIGQESWRIRYLLVDTSNWIGGKAVVVSSAALQDVDRDGRTLRVGLTRDEVKRSPSFESIEAAIGPAETGPPMILI